MGPITGPPSAGELKFLPAAGPGHLLLKHDMIIVYYWKNGTVTRCFEDDVGVRLPHYFVGSSKYMEAPITSRCQASMWTSKSHLLGIIKASASSVASLPRGVSHHLVDLKSLESLLCNNIVIHIGYILGVLRPLQTLKHSKEVQIFVDHICICAKSHFHLRGAVFAFHEFPEFCTKSQVDGHCVTFAHSSPAGQK